MRGLYDYSIIIIGVITFVLFMGLMHIPSDAKSIVQSKNDIVELIEDFIVTSTLLGNPHQYVWVIESMIGDPSETLIEIRVVSASLDRAYIRDERYRIVYAHYQSSHGPVTVFAGAQKIDSKTQTCLKKE